MSRTCVGGVGQENRPESTVSRSVSHDGTRSESYGRLVGGEEETRCWKEKQGKKGFGYGASQGAGPGNANVRELLSNEMHIEAVLDFLRATKAGEV